VSTRGWFALNLTGSPWSPPVALLICAVLLITQVGGCAPAGGTTPPAGQAGPVAAAPPAIHVRVAYPIPIVTMTGFYIATQQGYTAEEGLDAEMIQVRAGAAAQTMLAREIDFGMSAGTLLTARLRGAPFKNVFVAMDKPLYYLFAQPSINGIRDLLDMPIGVARIGTSTHVAAMAALNSAGVPSDRVTFIANAGSDQALAALQSGAVAATVVTPPGDVAAEQMGYRNLGFLGDYLDYLTAGLATHEDVIRDRPELVRAIVRAALKAHRYMQQNREGTIAYLARFVEIEPAEAALAYDRHMKHLTVDGLSTPERLEMILRGQQQELELDEPTAVIDAFDLSFARQAIDELNRANWRP
jgi:NitT/TauT family transport system substrate-binding protein